MEESASVTMQDVTACSLFCLLIAYILEIFEKMDASIISDMYESHLTIES